MDDKKKNLELKKHVGAIHSSNKLSLLQRKIANALLFNAYDALLEKAEHSIHIATLCNLIGYDSNDYKTIKKALVNLLATVIEWNLVDGSRLETEGVWNASSIIADASIAGPICTYSYSNKMKNLLYRPELYGRLNMLVQAKFQSTYGLALYENCIRFQRLEQTPWFDILQFRKLMGVEEGKYKIFRDFKHRVIDKAVEEVNKYSSVKVIPQLRRQGRKVIAIQFTIEQAKHEKLDVMPPVPSALSTTLKNVFGLSKKQIQEVLTSYEVSYVQEKISVVQSSPSYIQGKIAHLAKYFLYALKDDYQIAKKSKKQVMQTPVFRESNVPTSQETRETYRRHQNKEIMQHFAKQSKKSIKAMLIAFEKFLGRSIYKDIYLRDNLKNILIQDQLCLFIRQNAPQLVEKTISFDEFVNKSSKVSKKIADRST